MEGTENTNERTERAADNMARANVRANDRRLADDVVQHDEPAVGDLLGHIARHNPNYLGR